MDTTLPPPPPPWLARKNVKGWLGTILLVLTVLSSLRFLQGPSLLLSSSSVRTHTTVVFKSVHRVTTSKNDTTAVVCVIVHDDEAYLDEWVDYHSALRWAHFYVYDTSVQYELRQWGREKGQHVTVIHWPLLYDENNNNNNNNNNEMDAMTDCVQRTIHQHTWVGFFNVSDFLVLKQHRNVIDFLQTHCPNGGLSIHGWVFGAAGRTVYAPQPVTKRFLYRHAAARDTVMIVRIADLDTTNDTMTIHAWPPRLLNPPEMRGTAGNLVESSVYPRQSRDIVVFHHYLRSIKEQRVKMGQGIYIRKETTHNPHDSDNNELVDNNNTVVLDDSAWRALTMLLPKYKIYNQNWQSRPAPLYPSKYNETVAVCAVVKYEEAYIDEWVDYHFALGMTHFYVYDNSPDYEMRQWAFEKGNHVTTKHFPGRAQQLEAYLDCLQQFIVKKNYTWVALIDVDEMIHLKKHNNLVDMLHEHCPNGSLGLNWVYFGPSSREVYQPLPFTQRFKYRSISANGHVKSIARVADIDLTNVPHCHFVNLHHGVHMDVNGHTINEPYYWNPRIPENVAVLNHYYTRSYKEWVTKRMRGRSDHDRVHQIEELIKLAKSRTEEEECPLYTEAGWEATKQYLPFYEQFEQFENASQH